MDDILGGFSQCNIHTARANMKRSLNLIDKLIKRAQELGTKVIIVHNGLSFFSFGNVYALKPSLKEFEAFDG